MLISWALAPASSRSGPGAYSRDNTVGTDQALQNRVFNYESQRRALRARVAPAAKDIAEPSLDICDLFERRSRSAVQNVLTDALRVVRDEGHLLLPRGVRGAALHGLVNLAF
eukprot:scaffold20421_cov65-Phaeocystis_antarctica.AAC.3